MLELTSLMWLSAVGGCADGDDATVQSAGVGGDTAGRGVTNVIGIAPLSGVVPAAGDYTRTRLLHRRHTKHVTSAAHHHD